tara:strand:+ start:645 stop:929 length:285 start_codon:yes stop_codon:yes gene_type:complete
MFGVNYKNGCPQPPSDTDINLSKLIFLILKSLIIPFVKIQSIPYLTLLFNESINISFKLDIQYVDARPLNPLIDSFGFNTLGNFNPIHFIMRNI